MKKFKFNKKSIVTVSVLVFSLVFGFSGANTAHATLAPDFLGVATGYSVFGNAGVTNNSTGGTTHVWGNVGGNGVPSGTGVTNLSDANQVDGAIDAGANSTVVGAISSAYGALDGELLTYPLAPVLDLSAANTNITPGVYDIGVGAPNVAFSAAQTLNGAGVYIFRSAGGTVARTAGGTMILTGGATACNVYWQIADSMTFATGAGNIAGTIITHTAAITFADTGVTLEGRAWAATQVTMINTVITAPTCTGNLTVTKVVHGGSKGADAFPLHVGATLVTSGDKNPFTAGTYAITETNNSNYTHAFSNGCDATGHVTVVSGADSTCTITNTYHPTSSGSSTSSSPVITQPTPTSPATLTIIKRVVGSIANASLFKLHVKNAGVDVLGSPNIGVAAPGIYYSLPAGTYVISEDANPSYVRTFSGDCDLNGSVTLSASQNKTCVVTNTRIFVPSLPKTGFPPQESGTWYESLLNNILNLFR